MDQFDYAAESVPFGLQGKGHALTLCPLSEPQNRQRPCTGYFIPLAMICNPV